MKTTEIFLQKLVEMEGCRLTAYRDEGGTLTIGYGHTKNVREGDRISKYWAKVLLQQDIEEVERQVRELNVARTEGQLDALVSFAFNLGIGRLKESSLLEVIRKGGSKAQIVREFKKWVYAGGKKLPGLVKRREWEAKRFFEVPEMTDQEIIDKI
jgi:lysozyme